MRKRWQKWAGGVVLAFGVLMVWAVWASAQTVPSNAAAASPAGMTGPSADERPYTLGGLDEGQLTFGLKNIEFLRDHRLLGEPLWKYVASIIYLFLAFYGSRLLDALIQMVFRRWAAKTKTQLDDLVLKLLRGPVKVVAFVILVHIGLNVFTWQPWVKRYLSNGLKIVVAISLTYVVVKLVDVLLALWQARLQDHKDEQFQKQLFPIIRRSFQVFIVIAAFLVTAPQLGLDITGLIASLSIGGLALGLAAQDTLANLFGAVAVLVDKPFHVGDRIQLDSVDGVVEDIGFRSTRVRNLDGHVVTVPNKTVGNATITNITRRPNIRTIMNLGITYNSSRAQIEQALQITREVFRSHPNTHDVWVSFNKYMDFSLNLQVIHWWNNTDYRAYLDGLEAMNLQLKERFDAAGLEFAFPTQTIYVKSDAGGPPPPAAPEIAT